MEEAQVVVVEPFFEQSFQVDSEVPVARRTLDGPEMGPIKRTQALAEMWLEEVRQGRYIRGRIARSRSHQILPYYGRSLFLHAVLFLPNRPYKLGNILSLDSRVKGLNEHSRFF